MMTKILLAALLACAAPLAAFAENVLPVQKGYRGLTLPLPAHQLQFVRPGDRVDVFVTFEAQLKGAKEWADNLSSKMTGSFTDALPK